MKPSLLTSLCICIALLFANALSAQQLYVEGYLGRNRTNFSPSPNNGKDWYTMLGARVAGGFDHFQLGFEASNNLSKAKFDILNVAQDSIIGTYQYRQQYFGLFVRSKISKYPARRFGLHLLAGLGLTQMERTASANIREKISYETAPSYNGGIGISIPSQGLGMVELGYMYYHTVIKESVNYPKTVGSYHSIHLGFSLNYVFGKRAKEYDMIQKR